MSSGAGRLPCWSRVRPDLPGRSVLLALRASREPRVTRVGTETAAESDPLGPPALLACLARRRSASRSAEDLLDPRDLWDRLDPRDLPDPLDLPVLLGRRSRGPTLARMASTSEASRWEREGTSLSTASLCLQA